MVENSDESPSKKRPSIKKRRRATPEEIYLRGFLEYSGTENVVRFFEEDMHGVSLTRAREAIFHGEMIHSDKCDGPGCICLFRHETEDDAVEVEVFFVAGEGWIEFRKAESIEVKDGQSAA